VTGCLRIGSRGSKLALVQSEWVRDRLQELHPGLVVEIEVIQTKGDKILDAPLAKIGDKGLFTKELEAAIMDGRADLAVHSAKDMPTETPDGLAIVAFTAREDVRDVFVARARADGVLPRSLADLSAGAVVGTSSLRRRSQLLAARPDLTLVDIRGNVQTRLRKVEDEGMSGTVLAAAGLARLGLAEAAAFAFSFDEMLPAVGQGSLAIEARADDDVARALVMPLQDEPTAGAVRAERALMRTLEGGCQVPIAALGEAGADGLRLRASVGSLDGRTVVRRERAAAAAEPEALGRALAEDLLAAGADAILRAVRAEAADG
jgi:hydroxymethylbilane synthase